MFLHKWAHVHNGYTSKVHGVCTHFSYWAISDLCGNCDGRVTALQQFSVNDCAFANAHARINGDKTDVIGTTGAYSSSATMTQKIAWKKLHGCSEKAPFSGAADNFWHSFHFRLSTKQFFNMCNEVNKKKIDNETESDQNNGCYLNKKKLHLHEKCLEIVPFRNWKSEEKFLVETTLTYFPGKIFQFH